jgi:hypothetical protein
VTFVAPANIETGVAINRKITATFSEAMRRATISTATFTVTGPGTAPVTGTVTDDAINHIAIFTPASDLAISTLYTATITTGAKDLDGNALASNFIWTFTTGTTRDTTRPTVILVNPADLATGAPINTAVTAAFSEVMDPLTLTTVTFTVVKGPGATPVTGTVTYIGTTATFTPASDLAISTLYTATITTGAKDLAGNALASDFVWTFTTGTTRDTTRPTVILVAPADLATAVPLNTAVNATFSEAMMPGTIITANFTLTGLGGDTVIGVVTYNSLTDIATFTPSSPLALDTKYTATITTGAEDLAGNALLSNYVWSFTTSTLAELSPPPVALGAAADFVILAGGAITDVPASVITGDVGLSPASGSFYAGLTCPEVSGSIYEVDVGLVAVCAVTDAAGLLAATGALTTAYNDAAGRTLPAPATVSGDQGGVTLAPGIYKSTSSLSIASGNLTLDAQGDGNAVWIFQIASTFTTVGCGASVPCATGGNVMLKNGAVPANVFWQVGSSATVGQYTLFNGTILAYQDISINTGAEIHGRLLAGAIVTSGAVTLISDIVTIP